MRLLSTLIISTITSFAWSQGANLAPGLYDKVKPLTPSQSIKTIQVPKGYKIQLVASEPMIKEPVDCVWDANGDMYVIEMSTYMQDADAKGEFNKSSRVIKLTDVNGDGKMDKSSVFIDNLLLPRMILPLDDRILVCETNNLNIYSYRDTNKDGKADEKTIWYQGGARKGNLEHQASGLIWNLDNWIYITKGRERFKIQNGQVIVEKHPAIKSQWGLAADDAGHFSSAQSGAEESFQFFQTPTIYSQSTFPKELEEGFNTVWPIDDIPDTQGGLLRLRTNNTLNHFTAACGHGVYRGALMPEFYGNYLVCEPVGRLIRMAEFNPSTVFKQLKNSFPKSEFIRSSDANFRPVNVKTGPDGAIYIVDMYRGVIQEANWTTQGTYLRHIIDKYGLANNIQRGRIYRLVPENHNSKYQAPQLLNLSSQELLPLLASKNGWMRTTVRKILVLRYQQNLKNIYLEAFYKSHNTQEKIEILWTLDGIDSIDFELIKNLIFGDNQQIALQALRISDRWLKNDSRIHGIYEKIYQDSATSEILAQVFLSLNKFGSRDFSSPYLDKFIEKYGSDPLVKLNVGQKEKDLDDNRKHAEFLKALEGKGPFFQQVMKNGEKHYNSLCFACHGKDGQGVAMAGTSITLAPALKGSKRVLGPHDALIKIALHGLIGPVDGKTYPGAMESLASHDNQYIADVLTYISNSWGNKSKIVTWQDVRRIRGRFSNRKKPWSLLEIEKVSK
ncbi:c-type cytochrome [Lentisphaera profundi]|uniref:C-type cytochrome n=1 Tax=Lentisphaera profundi TaxID=1658616 RepID=A0ABY7VWH2_9BACT|nr:c-type cytochrome [Lentisphaera profundi]WDE98586.1 c-type cytochrome [Lentisphaera profundi]